MKQLFTLALLFLAACSSTPQSPQQVDRGRIDYYPSFASEHFAARDVLVWLPEDYSPEQRYGVLYMHDAQMLFDKTTSWNGQSWNIDSVAQALIDQGRVAPFLVVGINNNEATRLYDYVPRRVWTLSPSMTRSCNNATKRNSSRTPICVFWSRSSNPSSTATTPPSRTLPTRLLAARVPEV